jgi:D-alanyl-D-alanine carboxypeptidase
MRKLLILAILVAFAICGCGSSSQILTSPANPTAVPSNILAIMNKPLYSNATWSLRVLDRDTGELVYDLNSDQKLLIASVRKVFSVATTLEELGADHQFKTRVHRVGNVDLAGVLTGDLILLAGGDVTMGLRRQADGTMAIARIDHNEARAVGTAVLTNTEARRAYRDLAQDLAAGGLTEVTGEIIVDDRLFPPFNFRGEYDVTPIFINENFVDVAASPTTIGQPAQIVVRPDSAAFSVLSTVNTVSGTGEGLLELDDFFPDCFGTPGCSGTVTGDLPIDGGAVFTGEYPVVQNFRITDPTSFARTVFIEELQSAGITVNAALVTTNPSNQLPPPSTLTPQTQLAEYVSLGYAQYARLILKVSFNLGADMSLLHFGLSQGVNTPPESLQKESARIFSEFGIPESDFCFFDGSGGGETRATSTAVTTLLQGMVGRANFQAFFDGFPVLAVDGTLGIVDGFQQDPTLIGATGNVFAKTGTLGSGTPEGLIKLDARAMAGYMTTRSGRNFTFMLNVNDAGVFEEFLETVEVNDDLGIITAILWRDN